MADRQELVAQARRRGIDVQWRDTQKDLHDVSSDVLRCLLDVLGPERRATAGPPVILAGADKGVSIPLPAVVREVRLVLDPRLGAHGDHPVRLTRGPEKSSSVDIAEGLPVGRHVLDVEFGDGSRSVVTVLVPPASAVRQRGRSTAVFAPCYSLRSAGGHGLGDLRDLDDLASAVAPLGVDIVSTLPLYATFTGAAPFDPSPYSPVSRRHWNELYADLGDLPGPDGQAAMSTSLSARARDLGAGELVDWREVATIVHAALDRALAVPSVLHEVMSLAEVDADAGEYASFRAVVERTGRPPAPGTALGRDRDDPVARRHLLGQLLMRRQLSALDAAWSARGQALALDLPVGSHPLGHEVWRHEDDFAIGAAVGAPPDDFFIEGQCWGFPPLHPERSRATGHRVWHEALDAAGAQAGILRIDHVMAVHRLWWIPDGAEAAEGAYVRYPSEELWALLAITSHLHDCTIVGEDLGTVPLEVEKARRRWRVLGMYEEQFTVDTADATVLPAIADDVVAGIRTHDMMPFRAFVTGTDRVLRQQLGIGAPEGSDAVERNARVQQWRSLSAADLGRAVADTPEDLLLAALERLARSAAPVVTVDVDELIGEELPHNVPGVPDYEGAWSRRLASTVEEVAADRRVVESLHALERWRRDGPSVDSS